MNSPIVPVGDRSRINVRKGIVGLLLLMLAVLVLLPQGGWAEPPRPEKAVRGPCVRDPEWMRRNHMDFLKHKREETVREGKFVKSESFLACADCHTSRERFCDRCHAYVAVAPNCFECHQYPK
ncbi:MAG: hypothetical protein HQL96_14895 [Magnetococcales bacterium]|nr:hypothetical protein [Magnetococcales bacterium]